MSIMRQLNFLSGQTSLAEELLDLELFAVFGGLRTEDHQIGISRYCVDSGARCATLVLDLLTQVSN